jgi:hypothetical protein
MYRAARSREVEVQQGYRLAAAEDHVLQAHVVVTDHAAARRIG